MLRFWKNRMTQSMRQKEQEKKTAMVRMGELFRKTDAFDPIEIKSTEFDRSQTIRPCRESGYDNSIVQCDSDIYQAVWREASLLRQKGELLDLCQKVQCPVVAIHGDYDPHPARRSSRASTDRFEELSVHSAGELRT